MAHSWSRSQDRREERGRDTHVRPESSGRQRHKEEQMRGGTGSDLVGHVYLGEGRGIVHHVCMVENPRGAFVVMKAHSGPHAGGVTDVVEGQRRVRLRPECVHHPHPAAALPHRASRSRQPSMLACTSRLQRRERLTLAVAPEAEVVSHDIVSHVRRAGRAPPPLLSTAYRFEAVLKGQ